MNNPTIREQWQAYAKGACAWCGKDTPVCCDKHSHAGKVFHRDPSWSEPQRWRGHVECTAMTFEAWAEWRIERLTEALDNAPCKCKCFTHGYGCGLEEATCKRDWKNPCYKCKALAAQPESGVTK